MILLAATVTACAKSPEDEAPVRLSAGLYEVTIDGGTLVGHPSHQPTEKICYSQADADGFGQAPLDRAVPLWPGCDNATVPPKGNAVGGERTCPQRAMPMRITYKGRHDATSFRIDGHVGQGTGETDSIMQLGSGDFDMSGTRVGDC